MISMIRVITPAPPGSRNGNRITALRWARILRDLGRRVAVAEEYRGERCDLLAGCPARAAQGRLSWWSRFLVSGTPTRHWCWP